MPRVVGQLPKHIYCWVDSRFTHQTDCGYLPCLWFGLTSIPARMWGCTALLESGAVYRNVPPHALVMSPPAFLKREKWEPEDAQRWNCYGEDFETIEYRALKDTRVIAKTPKGDLPGKYLFTAKPIGDGYSEDPSQDKEFTFVALQNGRMTVQPTNYLLFDDKSWCRNVVEFPTDLKRQTEVYSCEW